MERVHFHRQTVAGDCILEYDSTRVKLLATQGTSSSIMALTAGQPVGNNDAINYAQAFFLETQKRGSCAVRAVSPNEAREFFFNAHKQFTSFEESGLFTGEILTLKPLEED